jgi:hypothetical protein
VNDSYYEEISTDEISPDWSPAQKREFIEAAAANKVTTMLIYSECSEDSLLMCLL